MSLRERDVRDGQGNSLGYNEDEEDQEEDLHLQYLDHIAVEARDFSGNHSIYARIDKVCLMVYR